jgi:hypothetical protein
MAIEYLPKYFITFSDGLQKKFDNFLIFFIVKKHRSSCSKTEVVKLIEILPINVRWTEVEFKDPVLLIKPCLSRV